ncbi:MAG TPA: ABC transporter permease [Actinomycetota bacterium]|nr:ABC transporter permease [Actinomycetota bacterium]
MTGSCLPDLWLLPVLRPSPRHGSPRRPSRSSGGRTLRMEASRVAAVVRRHSYGMRNSPTRLVLFAFWPLLDLFLWGLITTFLRRAGTELPIAVSFFLGAILLWDLVFRTKNSVALCLLEENYSRNVITVMASPITPGEYLGGAVAFGLVKALVTFAVMSVLAWALFAFGVLDIGPMLAVYATILIVFGIALALVVIGLVLRLGYAADELTWVLAAALMPFAAVFYPVAALPGWAQTIAWFIPPAHVFELMRADLTGGEAPWGSLWSAIALDLAYLAAAFAFARAMFASFLRRGLITRYM